MISWRNPGAGDREIAFDDYRKLGVEAALATVGDIVPGQQIHALGLLPGRHSVVDCGGRDGARWRQQVEIDHAARRADGFHRKPAN